MKPLRCRIIFLLVLCHLHHLSFSAADPEVDEAIMKTTSPQGWIIKTASSCYQVIIDSLGKVKPVFYANAEQAANGKNNAQWFRGIDEVPVRGGPADKIPVVEVVFNDNVRDADLIYVSGEIISIDQRPVLKIIQRDKYYPLEITSWIRVIAEYDILEKWISVKNTGKSGEIKIENCQSGNVVLPSDNYLLTHLSGEWGHEFQQRETFITPGIKTLQASDFKSFTNTAWYMIRPNQEKQAYSGPAWFGSIQYSGNWRIDIGSNYAGNVQVVAGINFWDTWWTLKPGASFETPKFISGYTNQGAEGASDRMRGYVKNTILPATHREELRPVIYNSWYATLFDVNENGQTALAKVASKMGVELFVMDDGWFKGRVTDSAGLGDWVVDKNKFPNGLKGLIKNVNDLGMKFGLWIEPEMVNPRSDLYRAHPDWVFSFPHRKRYEMRQQLMLNLAREEVYQYLLESISTLLQENKIDYIKWDHNRTLTEPGWTEAAASMQREVRIRYINNLYRLIDEIRKRFPKVIFENCSSGGGRADLGMLSRMDHEWVSDNTDPIDRIFINYGYLNIFPANTLLSLTTYENYHGPVSLDFKFNVAMAGILGIGNDITKFTNEENALAATKIAQYKIIRPLIQQGTLYRLISPYTQNKCALQYVAADSSESVLLCYNIGEYMANARADSKQLDLVKFRGLKHDQLYEVEVMGESNEKRNQQYRGDYLMSIGLEWPLKGNYTSKILRITPAK